MLDASNYKRCTTFKVLPFLSFVISIYGIAFAPNVTASIYIGTQQKQLHYDLQTLVEWGYLDVTSTNFPVPWEGIADGLLNLNYENMNGRPRRAYFNLLQHMLSSSYRGSRHVLELQGASQDVRFRSLNDGVEESAKITLIKDFYLGNWSGQMTVNYTNNGGKNFDNSFITYQFGDWNLRLGSLDQWWGPGQSSSLIMSNNTRPIKALAFSRAVNTGSESPWLSWLGPWYFTGQLGQLEQNRHISKIQTIMNRFSARPLKGLELGLSWVAMWGGEGQSNDFKTLFEVLTFKGICTRPNGDCSTGGYTKRGNHMAGIDITYTAHILDRPVTFYMQRIGEDAVGFYNITDNADLFGVSTYWGSAKLFLEKSDTNVRCGGDNTIATNCYYEHGTYVDGYRMYGRTFGSTFDSDAKQFTLGLNLTLENGGVIEMYLRSAELNPDGQSPSPALTKDISEDMREISGFYQHTIGHWLVKAGGSIAKRQFVDEEAELDAVIYLKAQLVF